MDSPLACTLERPSSAQQRMIRHLHLSTQNSKLNVK